MVDGDEFAKKCKLIKCDDGTTGGDGKRTLCLLFSRFFKNTYIFADSKLVSNNVSTAHFSFNSARVLMCYSVALEDLHRHSRQLDIN